MEYNQIVNTVNDFLVEEFEVDEEVIQDDAGLIETLDLDSLDFVDLVVIIESNFGFKAQGEDFKEITTFKQFYEFIDNKVNN
jgi:acyl carrier protein